jgi:hypothetical protein
MAYTNVHAAAFAPRTGGDVPGRVEVGLLFKAASRLPIIADDEDQRERAACKRILDGDTPSSWVTAVLIVLDLSAQLSNPTDPQVNTAVDTAWAYIISAR